MLMMKYCKKTILFLILCLFSCTIVSAQEVFKNDELSISVLDKGVWVVETADMTTMYIVEGTKRAMLIDTGTKCEALDSIVRTITKKPLYVVLTHNHGDHSGNAHYFSEVYLHPLDTVVQSKPYPGKYHWLKDGDVFDLGDRKIEVSLMPGHTPGSVVLIDSSIHAIYTGDAFGSGELWMQLRPHVPMKTLYESCIRMEKIMRKQNITKLYLGHYPYLKRAMGLDYLLDMKQLAKQLSDGDLSGSTPYQYASRPTRSNEKVASVKKGDAIIVFDTELLSGDLVATFGVEQFVYTEGNNTWFPLVVKGSPASIMTDESNKGVLRAVNDLYNDFKQVTGYLPQTLLPNAIIIGTVGESAIIDGLIREGKIAKDEISGKNEKYLIQTIDNPVRGVSKGLVIAGSDKRGTIYGIYELAKQMGVSPWYWWADVPVKHQENLYVKPGKYTNGEPAVKYRGIFINDEAPAFQGWCVEKFGGVNSKMYEHIFELILRLNGNFLWPAMWGNALYDDDPATGALADEMGIVIGTSHHEPMGRAHDEWRRYGKGEWNYDKNPQILEEFWRSGMERMKNYETVVTVGMRGDGDEPMSEGANIDLLQRIVKSQRNIIAKVTGKKTEETPQVWALYKEVQDYYDKGMRVPDDITLLLCDDNWGNVRKLPDLNAPKRKGGYGMYYHFDYVGGPRNYKWLNVTPIQRTWEQMNLTYEHGVDKLWVVNVGDLKPMEYPISFFLDMAWNPKRFNANNLLLHTENWCVAQFGEKYAQESARLINLYTKYNRRVTPELLNESTYSLENYKEFETVVNEYKDLAIDALRLYNLIPNTYKDAFDQLVLFPINACSNLYEMYYAVAMNRYYVGKYDLQANEWADKVKACFERDSLLTLHYNQDIAGGKWAHTMDQTHIGYTYWQQPERNAMPKVEYVYRSVPKEKIFIEKDGYISIEAENFARSQGTDKIHWEIIPGFGKTKSGVTTFPQNVYPYENDAIYLEYDIQTESSGDVEIQILLAPTLNFNANKGLRYALSFDDGEEKIVNFNGHYRGELGPWQGESIIKSSEKMQIAKGGKHTLRIRVLETGIVFEKILLNWGGLKPSYLGAPESEYLNNESPFPASPPAAVNDRVDHDQMMRQLGITYPVIPNRKTDYEQKMSQRLQSFGTGVSFIPENPANPEGNWKRTDRSGGITRTSEGLWNNYIEVFEPGGDYFSGAKFYQPLALHDLSGVTPQTWPQRRNRIFEEVQKIYGQIPPEATNLKIEWHIGEPTEVKEIVGRDGKTTPTTPFRQYILTGKIDPSTYPGVHNIPVISGILRIPANLPENKKTPIVINYAWSFGGQLVCDEVLWKVMASENIGTLYFNPIALQPDNGAGLTSYLVGLVNKGEWRKPSDWGTLVAWSWGISRIIDFFEKENALVDTEKIALTGHSRYGKAVLVAMAYDTRIATAFPSSSGAMGVAPSRRHWGEDLENCVWNSEYHWIAGNAMQYTGVDESSTDGYMPRKVKQMPVDAESLVALCAPRPIFIGNGSPDAGDAWADPYGQYLTTVAASPVYELLGKKGVVMDDVMNYNGQKIPMPVNNKDYLQGDIGYRQHSGGHEAAPNYPAFKNFILKYW
jgi:glyoxylase-like metal-dependent hydrolase (beta-lactamase superfamily II)